MIVIYSERKYQTEMVMILRNLFAFSFLVQSSSKILLLTTKEERNVSKEIVGSDYMAIDKKMVDKKEQTVSVGKSVTLRCGLANGTISKCFYHKKKDRVRYTSEPGASFEGGRIKCLCDVCDVFFFSSFLNHLIQLFRNTLTV